MTGRTVGAVVDAVSGAAEPMPAPVKPAPEFRGAIVTNHRTGVATIGESAASRMHLLDFEQLLASREMGLVDGALH